MMSDDPRASRRRELQNMLASISNVLYSIQHKADTWDNRIKGIMEIQKAIPLLIRYMVYFKNVEEK